MHAVHALLLSVALVKGRLSGRLGGTANRYWTTRG